MYIYIYIYIYVCVCVCVCIGLYTVCLKMCSQIYTTCSGERKKTFLYENRLPSPATARSKASVSGGSIAGIAVRKPQEAWMFVSFH